MVVESAFVSIRRTRRTTASSLRLTPPAQGVLRCGSFERVLRQVKLVVGVYVSFFFDCFFVCALWSCNFKSMLE